MKKLLSMLLAALVVLCAAAPAMAYDVIDLPESMTLADAVGVFDFSQVRGATITCYEDNKYVSMPEQRVSDFYYEFANIRLTRKVYMTPFRKAAVTLDTTAGKKTVNLISGVQIGTFGSGYICYAPSDSDAAAMMAYYSIYCDSQDKQQGRDVVINYTDSLKLPSDEWAVTPVKLAAEKGLLTYELTGKYTAAVSRREFADLLARFICVKSNCAELDDYMASRGEAYISNRFPDCTGDTKNIDILAALGVISGKDNGNFDPDAPITRQEAAKLLCETAELFMYIGTTGSINFTDKNHISDWALFYVTWVSEQWIMNGMTDGTFMPLDYYTVQQAITTVNRLYEVVSK